MATVSNVGDDRQTFLQRFETKFHNAMRIVMSGESQELDPSSLNDAIKSFESLERQLLRVIGDLLTPEVVEVLLSAVRDALSLARSVAGASSASTSYHVPRQKTTRGRGGATYKISKEQLEFLVRIHLPATTIAHALGVSEKTIRRRLKEFNLRLRDKFADLNEDSLDELVRKAVGENKKIGMEGVRAKLKAQGVKVQRQRVRDAVERVDPVGIAIRSLRPKLQRSTYSVAAPNSLWHLDGNHKLIRYRIVIHGGIDGFTRLLVFLAASNNNKAATVLGHFTEAVTSYGVPSRIRVDQGIENNDVCALMEILRGQNRGSALRGKSCHNQRIERAWVDVWNGVTNVYYTLFAFLESKAYLDPSDDVDIWCLHQVYLPVINKELKLFRDQWNNHGLRTENGKSPIQLYTLGMLRNANSQLTAVRDVFDTNGIPSPTNVNGLVTPQLLQTTLGATRVEVPETLLPRFGRSKATDCKCSLYNRWR